MVLKFQTVWSLLGGVPQGSALGLIYCFYVDDMYSQVQSGPLSQFTDDNCLMCCSFLSLVKISAGCYVCDNLYLHCLHRLLAKCKSLRESLV